MTGLSLRELAAEAARVAYAVTEAERYFSGHKVPMPTTPDDPYDELITLLDAIAEHSERDLVQMIFDQRDAAWSMADRQTCVPGTPERLRFEQAEFFIDELNQAFERRSERVLLGSTPKA